MDHAVRRADAVAGYHWLLLAECAAGPPAEPAEPPEPDSRSDHP